MKHTQQILSFLVAGSLSLALVGSSLASPKDSVLNPHADSNRFQIHQGVENGQLSPREAKRLLKDQHRVDAYEDKARENGKISKKELRRLDRMQAEQRNLIEDKTYTEVRSR